MKLNDVAKFLVVILLIFIARLTQDNITQQTSVSFVWEKFSKSRLFLDAFSGYLKIFRFLRKLHECERGRDEQQEAITGNFLRTSKPFFFLTQYQVVKVSNRFRKISVVLSMGILTLFITKILPCEM